MKLYEINAGTFKLDGGAMHGVVPKSFWNKVHPADENNLCTWKMRCLLVEDGSKKILIDTGMGNKQDTKWQGYFEPVGNSDLCRSILDVGFKPNEITDVILTHLHFDHCGGAVLHAEGNFIPTFPNANYWVHEQQYQSSQQPNAREKATFLKENIEPLMNAGQLNFINKEQKSPFTNIELLSHIGHTDHLLIPIIHHNNFKVCFTADTIPSAYHIHIPYVMSYDIKPLETMIEKERLLERVIQEDIILYFDHDTKGACCQVEKTDKGYRAVNHGDIKQFI